jgi:hypothetical protein
LANVRMLFNICIVCCTLLLTSYEANGKNNNGKSTSRVGTCTSSCNSRVSVDEISSILGIQGLEAPKDSCSSMCRYPLGKNWAKVTIGYESYMTREKFDAERTQIEKNFNATVSDITGLGDAAYLLPLEVINSIFVLKGSVRIEIDAPATSTLDQVKKLATLIISRI